MARYTIVSRYTPYPARTTIDDAARGLHASPMRGSKPPLSARTSDSWDVPAITGETEVKPGAMSRFTSRPYFSMMGDSYSHRTPRFSVRAPSRASRRSSTSRLTKILVGISEREGTRRGNGQQEVRKVISCSGARKRKTAARILLGEQIELLPSIVDAVAQCGPAPAPGAAVEHTVRLAPVKGIRTTRE